MKTCIYKDGKNIKKIKGKKNDGQKSNLKKGESGWLFFF